MYKSPKEIIEKYIAKHDLHRDALMGRCRARDFVYHRIELAKQLRAIGLSYPRIGQLMNRDHATIMYYLKKDYKDRCKSRGK